MKLNAKAMYTIANDYSKDDTEDKILEMIHDYAVAHEKRALLSVSANIWIDRNLEWEFKSLGFDIDYVGYDDVEDIYYIAFYWDEKAITGVGSRHWYDTIDFEEEEE